MNENKCKEKIWGSSVWHQQQCSRNIWKDGFCKTHHPDIVKERRERNEKRYQEKQEQNPFTKALKRIMELEALLAQRDGEIEHLRNENLHYQMIINIGR
jgi:hypothetical protein